MMSSTEFSSSELVLNERPQGFLEDPPPHSKRAQQVRRLEHHGLYKVAEAVKVCGRRVEVWKYECGRSFPHKIIRSHLRFCCPWCDKHIAARLFKEHRAYRERLHLSGNLYRVTIRSNDYPVSGDGIRDLEEAIVKAVREALKDCNGWGFKAFTHYEAGWLIAKGIIYLPPGTSPALNSLSIASAVCTVSRGASVTAFEMMLADILRPCLSDGNGLLRADLMAAFRGGNHLRSLGVFYGLISKKRKEERLEQSEENLDLTSHEESGTALAESKGLHRPYAPPCPHCGPRCKRVCVSLEEVSEFSHISGFQDSAWSAMRRLLHRKYVF
jgi:hypothetical protein